MRTAGRTMRNFNTLVLTTSAQEICGPNPYRQSLVLSPVPASSSTAPALVAVTFAPGNAYLWQVPPGVTQVIDMYGWGAGGISGAGQAVNGGGGGGGGAFGTTGPLTVVPGSVFSLSVDAAGGGSATSITSPSGVILVNAGSGANAILSAGGAAGPATTGVIKTAGGAGGTANTSKGAGGGGSGGNNSAGGAGNASQTGGTAGGGAVLSGYGAGAAGGAGGGANIAGTAGTLPGSGGGGGGATTGASAAGGAGLVVIFYVPSAQQSGISFDQDPGLILNQGAFNFPLALVVPQIIRRDDIGDCVIEPWYAISGVSGQTIRVTEYSYVPEEFGRQLQGPGSAFANPAYSG